MSQTSNDVAKLKWRCRRGTKELDFLLESYLLKYFSQAESEEQSLFIKLLDCQDSQLITYLLGDGLPESRGLIKLVNKIRSHYKN